MSEQAQTTLEKPHKVIVWPRLETDELDMLANHTQAIDAAAGFVEFNVAQRANASVMQFKRHFKNEARSCLELLAHADHIAAAIGSRQMRLGANQWNFLIAFDKPLQEFPAVDDPFHLAETFNSGTSQNGSHQVFASSQAHFGFNARERQRTFAQLAVTRIAPALGRVVLPNAVLPLKGHDTDLFPASS